MTGNSQQIDDIVEAVRIQVGSDLTGYSKSVLSNRISERMERLGLDADQYSSFCRADAKECAKLADTVAIHVSSFFRNPIVFEILAQSVLPRLMEEKNEIRVWSAGCAAGEEPYSVAILIQEELKKNQRADVHSMIFATDIDQEILRAAEKAVYSKESLKDTKLHLVETWFSPKADGFELCPDMKKRVHFSTDNLLADHSAAPADSIFGSFDLILCRNVLIYFTQEKQKQILRRLYASLAKGGVLVLGDSEMLCGDLKPRFRTVDERNRIYQK